MKRTASLIAVIALTACSSSGNGSSDGGEEVADSGPAADVPAETDPPATDAPVANGPAATTTTSSTTSTTAATSTTALPGRPEMYAVDEDLARAALLTLQDFPVGWTASLIPDAEGGSVAWEDCVGDTGNGDLLDLGGVRASSDSFNSDDEVSRSVESTVTIAEQDAVDDFIAGFGDADCIRGVVESGLGDAFDELSVGELNLSPTGNHLVAYRITGTTNATESGFDISVETFVDLVVVQIGNALTNLEFYSARQAITGAEPFSATEIDGFVAMAADRLAGLPEAASIDAEEDESSGVPWTAEEMGQILGPPFVEYATAFGPEGTTQSRSEAWENVRAGLGVLLTTEGRIVTDALLAPEANPSWKTALEAMTRWYEDGPTLFEVNDPLRDFGYHFNLPAVWDAIERIPLSFGSGSYRVGSGPGEVPPGTYVSESEAPFDGCYWETLNPSGDIVANNFVSSGFRVVANVSSSAYSVEFDRCGVFWKQ